tara:strand:- start:31 stop:354 length:324 start_codon:yes stop_codon:yes gene_type:complete
MIKINYKILILFFLILFLNNCADVKDALEGKKRSEQSDEFLVKKKNPLQMPPDIGMLPKPDEINTINANQEDDGTIKKILNVKDENDNENKNKSSSDLIDNMIKKIQ